MARSQGTLHLSRYGECLAIQGGTLIWKTFAVFGRGGTTSDLSQRTQIVLGKCVLPYCTLGTFVHQASVGLFSEPSGAQKKEERRNEIHTVQPIFEI